ncbi:NAD-dependent epimerase/dehydratase family protein [Amycolatopsis sp. GA6-003]|uniref:NAD-dependent epimerase/dehydratase family protein n=1 Tax=Amycolatopsis sp. GA6-003 TaxID=2652444 RepID=UPI003916FAC5
MQRTDSARVALVTGGHGFIGTHLAAGLARRGFRVVAADRTASPDERVESARLDVTSFAECLELVRAVRPHVVFHLAAFSTVDSAFSDPHASLATNIGGTANMLEAARAVRGGLARFVLASTDKVYGELCGDAYVETSRLDARGVYDVGKMAADHLVRLYGGEFGLPVAILRLCNVFGPGDPHTASRIVPRTLSRIFAAAGPLPPVVYEGSMAHGRDYVYVTDVVRALATLAFDPRACGESFNMVPAAHRATLDLVAEMIERSGEACEPHDRDRADAIRKNGYEVIPGAGLPRALEKQHCDGRKLGALGFSNQVSMAEGLRRTISSFLRSGPVRGRTR